jgi:hypothetical protein
MSRNTRKSPLPSVWCSSMPSRCAAVDGQPTTCTTGENSL